MKLCKDVENIILGYKNEMEFVEKYNCVLIELKKIKHTITDTPNCLSHHIYRFGNNIIFTAYTIARYEPLPNLYVETHYDKYLNYGLATKVIMLVEKQHRIRNNRPTYAFSPTIDVDSDYYDESEEFNGTFDCCDCDSDSD